MAESKMFHLLNGVTLEKVVGSVEMYMRTEKGMDIQKAPTTDGFVLQGSQAKDGWKTISGTRLAITVQFATFGDAVNVTVGEGQWSDKIGAGAIGWFVAWPFALTAGIGAFKQKKLPQEVFNVIEKCIMLGGQSIMAGGAGATVAAGTLICPACGAQCQSESRFCNVCGAKLLAECPSCGARLAPGSRFCNNCGQKV